MPSAVSTCSVRGGLGWPDCACTERNFRSVARFYMRAYAKTFRAWVRARDLTPARHEVLRERFLAGFASRTRAFLFRFTRHREELLRFAPPIPARYAFAKKVSFFFKSILWQAEHLDMFRDLFLRFTTTADHA